MIEIMRNDVTEYSNVVYLKHVYGQFVSDTFVGDKIYGSDRTLPIIDCVDASIKRILKMGKNLGAFVGGVGRGTGGVGKWSRGRGHKGYHQQQQWQQPQSFESRSYEGGGGGFVGPPDGVQSCYVCGGLGHIAKDSPNKK